MLLVFGDKGWDLGQFPDLMPERALIRAGELCTTAEWAFMIHLFPGMFSGSANSSILHQIPKPQITGPYGSEALKLRAQLSWMLLNVTVWAWRRQSG